VGVRVIVRVGVWVIVRIGVRVGVRTGLRVGVRVGVRDGVRTGVRVGVRLGVLVGVAVRRGVAVGDGLGANASTRLLALTVPIPVAKSHPTVAGYAGLNAESEVDSTPYLPDGSKQSRSPLHGTSLSPWVTS
jgi:hypothetical protein